MFCCFAENVPFGEVAVAPPMLNIKPRKAQNKSQVTLFNTAILVSDSKKLVKTFFSFSFERHQRSCFSTLCLATQSPPQQSPRWRDRDSWRRRGCERWRPTGSWRSRNSSSWRPELAVRESWCHDLSCHVRRTSVCSSGIRIRYCNRQMCRNPAPQQADLRSRYVDCRSSMKQSKYLNLGLTMDWFQIDLSLN